MQYYLIMRLHYVLDSIKPTQCRVSLLKWQQLVGELRYMDIAIAIPADIGLLSALQEALQNKKMCRKRVCLTQHTHYLLADFK
jgi:hypothetical protein